MLCAGVGATRALQLVQKHKTLEAILASMDASKYDIPDPYPFEEARRLFKGGQPSASILGQSDAGSPECSHRSYEFSHVMLSGLLAGLFPAGHSHY